MLIHKYRYHILTVLFLGTLLLLWPGITMYDSVQQYQQALAAHYSDHHPPLMAFVWRAFDHWHAGAGLMFLLQITCLYGGVYMLLRTADQMHFKSPHIASLLLLIFPIYPQILLYAVMVVKDVQMATSFLFGAGILAFYTYKKVRIPLIVVFFTLLLLIYGTAVKYQAKFIVIIFAFWLGAIFIKHRNNWQRVLTGGLMYVVIISATYCINNVFVVQVDKNYAWQYVKLYDLAAISLATKQDFIPEFSKTDRYTFTQLQKNFSYPAVDNLVFKSNPILKITSQPQEMTKLCQIWREQIYAHPYLYLKHRVSNMRHVLLARPGFAREAQDVPVYFVNDLAENTLGYKVIEFTIGALYFIFMSALPVIVLGFLYLLLAIVNWRKTKAAPILFAFSATATLMVGIIFFMSMAGTPRYVYVSIVLIHAAHIFAYKILRSKRQLN